jgi:hypothetical protein
MARFLNSKGVLLGIMRTLISAILFMTLAVGYKSQCSPIPAGEAAGMFAGWNECRHTAQSFYTQTGRWPTNFTELSSVTNSTDLSKIPPYFKQAQFKVETNGTLEISWQSNINGNGIIHVDAPHISILNP